MAGSNVTEKWTVKSLTVARDGRWRAERAWDVLGAPNWSDMDFIQSVPTIVGASHPANRLLKCDAVTADPGLNLRVVRATYSIPQGETGGEVIDRRKRIVPQFGTYTEPATLTVDDGSPFGNKPILNSTNQPFANPPSVTKSSFFLRYTQWEPYWDLSRAIQYRMKVNSTPFDLLGHGTVERGNALIHQILPTQPVLLDGSSGSGFVEIAYDIEFRDGVHPFQTFAVDVGTQGYNAGAGSPLYGDFQDNSGNFKEVLLDGTGKPLDDSIKVMGVAPIATPTKLTGGEILPGGTAGNPAILVFKTVAEVDFHDLGIGIL